MEPVKKNQFIFWNKFGNVIYKNYEGVNKNVYFSKSKIVHTYNSIRVLLKFWSIAFCSIALWQYGTCPSKNFKKKCSCIICTLLFRDTILDTIIKENDLENMQKKAPWKLFFKNYSWTPSRLEPCSTCTTIYINKGVVYIVIWQQDHI